MFPILFRVLTIAGSCTIAALLTRRYLQRKAEEENRYREQLRPQVAEGRQSTSDAAPSSSKESAQSALQSPGKSDKSKREEELAKKAKAEAQAVADIEAARRAKEAALAAARQAKNEKLAKTRESAAAAQKAAEAHRRSSESGSFPAVPAKNVESVSTEMSQAALEREQASASSSEETAQSARTEMSEAAEQSSLAQDFSPAEKAQASKADESELAAAAIAEAVESKNEEASAAAVPVSSKAQDPAEERAKVVLQSSKQIIDNYKQPDGVKVDLSLAQFSIETAERLMAQSRFEEAFEKASAVGLLVGMAEMRAAIETQLKAMKSDEKLADKAKSIRSILNEADASLAQASQSFVSDDVPAGQYMNHLQTAFQKTMQAQNEMMNVSV